MSDRGTYAAPPCAAVAADASYFELLGVDPPGVDPAAAGNVARWRRAERMRLAGLREGLGQAARAQAGRSIRGHLETVLAACGIGRGAVLAAWWPIRCEPDLGPLLSDLHRTGVALALPAVDTRAAPLVFRRWVPGMRLVRGDWKSPVPPPEAEALVPDIALVPCLGWDGGCYRLGWGGGYYDRTLAALSPRPATIGIALAAARLPTIYPQPHDVALDMIVTEAGVAAERKDRR